ncbi:MAG TPA: hypothetical protein VLL72_12015, partial [Kiloniellales bacterium]|nr:hypothetical protein [Kiloniellales bacterium]
MAGLSLAYLLLMVPFFCAANCIGLAFLRFGGAIGRIYRFDLTGAGLGASGAIALLFLLPPWDALRAVPLTGFGAAALVLAATGRRARAAGLALLAAGFLFALVLPAGSLMPRLSDYKALSVAQLAPGAEIVHRDASPLSLVTVLASPEVPIRYAPGLSLAAPEGPPPQLGLYRDADQPSAIPRVESVTDAGAFLDWTIAALPYHLRQSSRVLLLGSDGGHGLLLARRHGVERIDLVEPDPAMTRTLSRRFDDYAGGLFTAEGTRLVLTTPRAFIARTAPGTYDLIVLTGTGGAGGLAGLSETYDLTREAFVGYLGRLAPDGLLSVSLPLSLPPRGVLKLVATAIAALRERGAADPARHLFVIRTWNRATLVVSARPLSEEMIAAGRAFAQSRGFDLVYHPGIVSEQANRFNVLAEPYLYDGTRALLGPEAGDFFARYKFDLTPARDDRPYFHDFLRWSSLPELLALSRRGAMPLIEWGPLILLATLLQAAILSALLILLPLALRGRVPASPDRPGRARVAGYFLALGLGFLFLEIAFMQRLTLLLGHPLYAVALVLAVFLVSAGIGAGLSPRLARVLARRGS